MRYIRYKYQKQQINFLNCNDINKWIDTCQTRVIGFDSVCESNCNCGEIRDMEYQPQYRTKKLNPNYSYECVDMDRHYKLQKQISYDNGITWMDIDEYEIGELYESNSPFCSAEVIIYDWFPTGRYKCVGYNKINEEVKRVSFDNGLNWSDLSFVDDNGNVTYEYRFNASNTEENCCDCGYREYEWRISNPIEYVCDINTKSEVWYKWQYCPTDPSLDVKLDEVELRNPVQDEDYCGVNVYFVWDVSSKNYCQFRLNNTSYSATTENSVLNEDGTYTYIASLSDLGITEVTRRNSMFSYNENLLKLYKVPKSNDTSLNYMLNACYNLNYVDENALGDTSNVTTMSSMFQNCSGLTSLNLSNFDTSKVTTMSSMFQNCNNLTSLDVSSFNTSAVTNMNNMFYGCRSLTSLDLSNFNTPNVTRMVQMFSGCTSLSSLDLSNFNTSNVSDMNSVFYDCRSLTSLDLSSFDTSNIYSMYKMFYNCNNLTSLDLSNWDTSKVTSMSYMFYGCNSLNEIIMDNCSCDTVSFIRDRLNDVSLSNVLIYSNSGCEGTNCRPTTDREYNGYRIEVIKPSCEFYEVSNFNVYKVYTDTNTDINCNVSTSNGEELYLENQIPNRTNPNGYNDGDEPRTVTAYTDYGEYTFEQGVDPYTQYNLIYEWDSSNGGNSTYRLNGTSARTSDNPVYVDYNNTLTSTTSAFTSSKITNLIKFDIDTSNVTTMNRMFKNCSGLTSLDVSNFNTSAVTDMSYMFEYCKNLKSLDVSNFNTSNVSSIQYMFNGCSGLTSLDLSNFDTSNIYSSGFKGVLQGCSNLKYLDLSGWDLSNYTDSLGYVIPSSLETLVINDCNCNTVQKISKYIRNNREGCEVITNQKCFVEGNLTMEVSDLYGGVEINGTYYSANTNPYTFSFDDNYMTLNSIEFYSNLIRIIEVPSNIINPIKLKFYKYSGSTSLDLSNWGNIKLSTMYEMFRGCSALTSVYFGTIDTSQVTDMSSMFSGCTNLTSLDFSNFNTSNVTNMEEMFISCESLTSLDLSGWDTSKLKDTSTMFCYCNKLTSLDLSGWDLTNVTDMNQMFTLCTSLKTIYMRGCNETTISKVREELINDRLYGITIITD